jgi:ubiquinone/menaquinone biosynthesis C-methylase UbiE
MCQDCEDFIKKNSEILDLGCGSGIVGRQFQKFFEAELKGVDIKDQRIEKIPFQIFDGLHLPFSENSFDIVLINYVLHHTKDPFFLLREVKRVTRGKIIIFEDLPEGFLSKIRCMFHQVSYNIFLQKNWQKFNFKTKKEWKELFKALGLKVIAEKRVLVTKFNLFDPVSRTLFVIEKT